MAKFRKKPVVIEAWKWNGAGTFAGAPPWVKDYALGERLIEPQEDGTLIVPTLEGDHVANAGDWIIQGVQGELYPCKPGIFVKTYDYVEG